MKVVNIHEAKTHLSRLVEEAVRGEPFIICKAGKPMVKVVPVSMEESGDVGRLGFMVGEIAVPENFDTMGALEISKLFEGKSV